MIRQNRFISPDDDFVVVAKGGGPATILTPEAIEAGRQRIAGGESPDDVAMDLAMQELALVGLDEDEDFRSAAFNEDQPRDERGQWTSGGAMTKVGGQKGSNPGGVYEDSSGRKWYVKEYGKPERAGSEHVANEVYRAIGAKVPESEIGPNGSLATKWVAGSKGELNQALDKESANKVLDHYAADVFVANWDAVGLEHDNVLVGHDGSVTRVDQGGTLFYRAQGGLKPAAALGSIGEWDSLSDPKINPAYAKVFKKAGIKSADDLGDRAVRQIEAIEKARPADGWEGFVKRAAPSMGEGFAKRTGAMLEARMEGLLKKRDQLAQKMRGAAAEPIRPTQRAADANYMAIQVSIRHAFAVARGVLAKDGTPEQAVEAMRAALVTTLPGVLRKTLTAGGEAEQVTFRSAAKKSPLSMKFDPSNPNAAKWAKEHAAELADGLSESALERIRGALAEQFETGEDAADAILEAVGNDARAELIARTESMKAANEGQRQGWEQAVEKGLLPSDAERIWIGTAGMCPECEALDGTRAALDGEYGDGVSGPPLHPNCRCTEGLA